MSGKVAVVEFNTREDMDKFQIDTVAMNYPGDKKWYGVFKAPSNAKLCRGVPGGGGRIHGVDCAIAKLVGDAMAKSRQVKKLPRCTG